MKVALIGYGYWGKNIARNFSLSSDFELHTVCDLNPKNLEEAKKLYPAIQVTSDYKEISDEVDIVAPIVPVDQHYFFGNYFLDQNKHILLTKPFTKNYEQAVRLIEKANAKNLTAFADHTFIFNPAVRKMKEILPKIGTPYLVMSSRLNLGLYQPDVNVVYDLMPHDLSIINYLFDADVINATTTSFSAAGMPVEDFSQASIEFTNNIKAFVTVSWLSPYKIRDFIIVGSEGMISYDDNQVTEKIKYYDRGVDLKDLQHGASEAGYTARISYKSGDSYSPAIGAVEALKFEMSELYQAIHDKQTRDYYNNITLRTMKSLSKVIESQESNNKSTFKKSKLKGISNESTIFRYVENARPFRGRIRFFF